MFMYEAEAKILSVRSGTDWGGGHILRTNKYIKMSKVCMCEGNCV